VKKQTTTKHPARKRRNKSAGVLLFRSGPAGVEVLLAHPGGPFWQRKDAGAWSIPKGEIEEDEDELAAARREFAEETGYRPKGSVHDLGSVRQPSGKQVHVWAIDDDWDPARLVSNTFSLEWPPHSGRMAEFGEIDKAAWFDLKQARKKILKGQTAFLDRLEAILTART